MALQPTTAEKIRRLPYITAFEAFNTVFCQLTVFGTMFPLFLSELNLPPARISMVFSLIPFASVGSIFLAPMAARMGVKKVFLIFWGLRNVFAGAIVATPWIYWRSGVNAAFFYVIAMMAGFSLCRSFGEAATMQWRQDIIPHHVRGRFGAINNIVCTLASVGSLLLASFVLSPSGSLNRYVFLMILGSAIGGASIYWAYQMPGGMEVQKPHPVRYHLLRLRKTISDRNFILYMAAMSLVTFGTAPLGVFVPLFLKEKVGIPASRIVLVQSAATIGVLIASYFWGWAADRFGSKPVILSALALLVVGSVGWLIIPYHSAWSIPMATATFAFGGMAAIGYALGTGRQLYVTIVPPRRKTHYMSVYCAWMGVTAGTGQLLAGQSMQLAHGISRQIWIFPVNEYTFLFLFSIAMLVLGVFIQYRVKADGSIPVGRFVGMFFQGNPVMAAESLLRYHRAARDAERVLMIRRLGRARSPLSVDELAGAMEDPSFSVRYEAISAAARTRSSPRLTADLIEVLIGGQPDLRLAAAWALGRIGDSAAIAPLRWTFSAEEPLLQLRSARALVALGDESIAPELARRARGEVFRGEGVSPSRPEGILPSVASSASSVSSSSSSSSHKKQTEDGEEEARGRDPYGQAAHGTQGRDALATTDALATAEAADGPIRRAYADALGSLEARRRRPEQALQEQLDDLRRSSNPRRLVAALWKGDFAVRYEAIVLASHREPTPELTAALVGVLAGGDPDLSLEALWALGQIGGPEAVEALVAALAAPSPILRVRAARALANLGEQSVAGELRTRLAEETDHGLRIAYASALGRLRVRAAAGDILRLHEQTANPVWIRELNLAMARLIGQERFFISLWRRMRKEPGTSAARALHGVARGLRRRSPRAAATTALNECIQAVGRDDLARGAELLADVMRMAPAQTQDRCLTQVCAYLAGRLNQPGPAQAECLPLAIAALQAAVG